MQFLVFRKILLCLVKHKDAENILKKKGKFSYIA